MKVCIKWLFSYSVLLIYRDAFSIQENKLSCIFYRFEICIKPTKTSHKCEATAYSRLRGYKSDFIIINLIKFKCKT